MNAVLSWIGEGFEWALQTSWEAGILILVTWGVHRLLRKWLGAGLGYWLGLLVVVRLLMPSVPSSPFSLAGLLSPRSPVVGAIPAASWSGPVEIPRLAEGGAAPSLADPITGEALARGISFHEVGGLIWLLGALFLLAVAIWRYCRWSWVLRGSRRVTDKAVLNLVEESKRMLGVRRAITVVATESLGGPAVFGLWRIRLSLPMKVVEQFHSGELKLILLHELAHVRRHDLALQWIMMAAQFLHWFNPLVWLVMHRLRSDQEVLCDGAVLRLLQPEARVEYGRVLLKLLDRVTLESRMFSSAVPVLSSKHEIKRRIIMIKNYRPGGWRVGLVTALIVAVVGVLTLTGAGEEPRVREEGRERGLLGAYTEFTGAQEEPRTKPDETAGSKPSGLEILERKYKEVDRDVQRQQARVDEMRRKMVIPPSLVSVREFPAPDQEHLASLERERTSAEVESIQFRAMLERLQGFDSRDLAQILLSVLPDPLLSEQLSTKGKLQSALAVLSPELSTEHPQTSSLMRQLMVVEEQIALRAEGLMNGLRTRVEVLELRSEIASRKIDEIQARHAAQAERFHPYFAARQELQRLERIRESIMLRILQEKVDAALDSSGD